MLIGVLAPDLHTLDGITHCGPEFFSTDLSNEVRLFYFENVTKGV